jgi:hypothetical protein
MKDDVAERNKAYFLTLFIGEIRAIYVLINSSDNCMNYNL